MWWESLSTKFVPLISKGQTPSEPVSENNSWWKTRRAERGEQWLCSLPYACHEWLLLRKSPLWPKEYKLLCNVLYLASKYSYPSMHWIIWRNHSFSHLIILPFHFRSNQWEVVEGIPDAMNVTDVHPQMDPAEREHIHSMLETSEIHPAKSHFLHAKVGTISSFPILCYKQLILTFTLRNVRMIPIYCCTVKWLWIQRRKKDAKTFGLQMLRTGSSPR